MPAFCYHFHMRPADYWSLTRDEHAVLLATIKELNKRG